MSDPSSADAPGRSRGRGRRLGRWLRWSVRGLVLVVIAAAIVAVQTGLGQRLVVERVLELVRGSLAGELTVQGVRSGTLLTGVTMTGVRLEAEGDRRFLTADSLVLRYSPLSLLLGSPRLYSTTIHGLDLEISRYPGDDFLNVDRIIASRPAPDSAESSGPSRPRTIGLGRIAIRGAQVVVLTPAEDPAAKDTEPAPGGGALRRLAFEVEDLDLEETVLRPEGPVVV
ncbi:MAG TPA: hypothetical protein VLA09_02650, partial [Longimicrobiales bacterium]|nr:hypothetical protein [Longimicrobiales bacterium]